MDNVIAIPSFQDNYIWLITPGDKTPGDNTRSTSEKPAGTGNGEPLIIIDPGDAQPVLEYLHSHQLTPDAIFITHQCYDHVGGIKALLNHYPMPVYGPATEMIPCMTHPVRQDDCITIQAGLFQVIDVPGHTDGHVAYYKTGAPGALFCGDTLFAAGCGRLHTGGYDAMFRSLQKIAALPNETLIYCAHEYTLANLKFALHLEPDNADLQARMVRTQALRAENQVTIPSSLIEEQRTNPFLRCHTPPVITAAKRYATQTGQPHPVDAAAVFRLLRRWKDHF